jgi:hypothetical protein
MAATSVSNAKVIAEGVSMRSSLTAYFKDPDDPAWKDDAGVRGGREFIIKYVPDGDLHNISYVNS